MIPKGSDDFTLFLTKEVQNLKNSIIYTNHLEILPRSQGDRK